MSLFSGANSRIAWGLTLGAALFAGSENRAAAQELNKAPQNPNASLVLPPRPTTEKPLHLDDPVSLGKLKLPGAPQLHQRVTQGKQFIPLTNETTQLAGANGELFPFPSLYLCVPPADSFAANYNSNTTRIVIYVNGFSDKIGAIASHRENTLCVAQTFGSPVIAVVNGQLGLTSSRKPSRTMDVLNASRGLLSSNSGFNAEKSAAQNLVKLMNAAVDSKQKILIVAHSQGSIITTDVISRIYQSGNVRLIKGIQEYVELMTVGAAIHRYPRAFIYNTHAAIHQEDPVTTGTYIVAGGIKTVRYLGNPYKQDVFCLLPSERVVMLYRSTKDPHGLRECYMAEAPRIWLEKRGFSRTPLAKPFVRGLAEQIIEAIQKGEMSDEVMARATEIILKSCKSVWRFEFEKRLLELSRVNNTQNIRIKFNSFDSIEFGRRGAVPHKLKF